MAQLVLATAVLLAGCGAPAASSVATASATSPALTTSAPTPMAAAPTATPVPATATPAPTALATATSAPAAPVRSQATAAPVAAKIVEPSSNYTSWTYDPDKLTVHVGQTVVWTNTGFASHTVTARDRSFDSGSLARTQQWSFTFAKAGTYDYFCTFHPWMKATVTVVQL